MTVQEQYGISAPARAAAATKTVEVYDFRRPTTLAREHSRVLELAFETFARQWGTQLTAKVRMVCQVTCDQVLMQTYDDYASSLPASTAMVLCNLEGSSAKAVIQFPASTALTWVSHMLGGSGNRIAPERKFTQIEEALVRGLMSDALEDLRYSLGALLVVPISVDAIQYNSQFAQAAATADLMIVASFALEVGEGSSIATVALPARILLEQLGEVHPTGSRAKSKELLQAQLSRVPVEVSLRLTPVRVLPSKILDLVVGDILPIPHPKHRPLDLAVDGLSLARAAVGSNGSRLACIIIESKEKPR